MSNLYFAPSFTAGTKSSQIPEAPSERIGCRRPSHEVKSPTTETDRALGAQTANAAPAEPSILRTWAPSSSYRCSWLPSSARWRSSSPSVGRNEYGSRAGEGFAAGGSTLGSELGGDRRLR